MREAPEVFDEFRTPPSPAQEFKEPTLTDQSFVEECDINTLVRRFGIDGSPEAHVPPTFGDFASAADYLHSQLVVAEAVQAFEALPASVRERFNNDPARMLEFVGDPANTEQAIALGIATKKADPVPVPPQPVQLYALGADGKSLVPVQAPIQVPAPG